MCFITITGCYFVAQPNTKEGKDASVSPRKRRKKNNNTTTKDKSTEDLEVVQIFLKEGDSRKDRTGRQRWMPCRA
jgi:hypothetical protein